MVKNEVTEAQVSLTAYHLRDGRRAGFPQVGSNTGREHKTYLVYMLEA